MRRTWSIESVLRTLERITRPPVRMGHDVDGAEQLADKEAEEECSELSVSDIMSPGLRANEQSTLDDVVAQLCQLTYFVEDMRNIIQTSPAASTAGDSAGAVSPTPGPAPARSDLEQLAAIIGRHHIVGAGAGQIRCNCGNPLEGCSAYLEHDYHVAELIANALAPQPK